MQYSCIIFALIAALLLAGVSLFVPVVWIAVLSLVLLGLFCALSEIPQK